MTAGCAARVESSLWHLFPKACAQTLDEPVANFINAGRAFVVNNANEVFVFSRKTCCPIRERHGVSIFDVTWVERRDIREVPVGVLIVQAVSDNELIGNVEGDEVGTIVDLLLTFLQQ